MAFYTLRYYSSGMKIFWATSVFYARTRRFLTWLVLMAFLGTGPAQAMTIQEERELGERLLPIIRSQFQLIDEPDVAAYIRGLGQEVLKVAGPQPFNYHFFVIANREFNAFAAPAGLIAIFSGLIEATASEGELLSVVAHEVGHAASRHHADRLAKKQGVQLGTAALVLAGIILGGGGALGEALATGAMAGGATLNLRYSREDEEEADRLALNWMSKMERDPAEMLSMLRTMRNLSRFHRAQLPDYFLTHPEPEKRIAYLENHLRQRGLPTRVQPPRLVSDENFELDFHRIRIRVLTLTRSPLDLRPIFKHQLRNGDEAPAALMARFGLSQIYLAERQHDKALEEINKVIARFPNNAMLLADRAIILFEAGQQQEALRELTLAAAREPDNPFILFHQARILQQLGQLSPALSIYQRLLRLTPTHARLHFHYGQARSSLGEIATGHYHLGLYHWYTANIRMARHHLNQAIQRDGEKGAVRSLAEKQLATIDRLVRR